jgi:hypothetical protein
VQYAVFLESQRRWDDARAVLARGLVERAKPEATLASAQAALEARAAAAAAAAVHDKDPAPDLRPALQAMPHSARHPDALGRGPSSVVAPALVHTAIVAAPRRAAPPASSSALNSQLYVYKDADAEPGAGPRRPLDWATHASAPAPADEVRKENSAVPTTWNDAIVPMVRCFCQHATGKHGA